MSSGGFDKKKNSESKKAQPSRRITSEEIRISLSKQSAKKSSKVRIRRAVLIVLFTCIAAFVAINIIFFNVETIKVNGNSMYSVEEIIKSSGISEGMNFLEIRGRISAGKIRNDSPGISDVRIKKKFPTGIEITVTESVPSMYITIGEFIYTLDENLVALQKYEKYDDIENMGLVRIYIPEIIECVTGKYISTADKDVPEMLKTLITHLKNFELFRDVKEIDFTNKFDIRFTLGVKYTVKLGNIIDCDTKLEFLCGIIEELGENDTGTIDLSDGNMREAIFSRQ